MSGDPVSRDPVPAEIRALADARALARAARDWPEADRLRAKIEDAGWTVVDRGFSYAIRRAHAPDVDDGEGVRYGRSASVPSRLGEPPVGPATVVLVATHDPITLPRSLERLRRHAPAGTSVVVVADDPSDEQEGILARTMAAEDVPAGDGSGSGVDVEIVRTSARLGIGAVLNIGLRRASGPVVIVLDSCVEPVGDVVTPLIAALDDPDVGVVGAAGLVSDDLRRFVPGPTGDAVAVSPCCLAFRRDDGASRGPLDELFHGATRLAAWWSLVLRDEGDGRTPRRAVALDDLPLVHHEHSDQLAPTGSVDHPDRTARRDTYRILDRFRGRTDLVASDKDDADRR